MPERMTDEALWNRAHGLIARSYFAAGHTPRERDELLDELQKVLQQLRLRGGQGRIF